MKIGKLQHYIDIQTPTNSADGLGNYTKDWENVASVWASIGGITAKTRSSEKEGQKLTHSIAIRYFPGVSTDMRILYGSRIFKIQTVINEREENRWLYLLCEEIQ